MKKFKSISLLLLIIILAGCTASSNTGPIINLEKEKIDFGFITLDDLSSQNIEVKNNGDELLIITGVSTSCGCTSAQIDNKEIAPNESAQLTITFDPKVHNTTGEFVRYVYINSNDPQGEREIELSVNVTDN